MPDPRDEPAEKLTLQTHYSGRAWRMVCSCGKYRSKWLGYPGYAEKAGLEHFETKHGKF